MNGTLYIVATPIGNLNDLSPRASETLATADFIAAEDTRVTAKLLNRFNIKTPLISYYEHNKKQKGEYILSRLLSGENCALVTDAGTPAISDPGVDLVDLCLSNGIAVRAVAGPSAIIAALSISGMNCGRFCFEGFLSTSKKSREAHLKETALEKRTMVFYEAPHKLVRTLKDMLQYYGDRKIALCRELTKIHEETERTTLSLALEKYSATPPRGEFVLIVEGCPETPAQQEDSDPLDDVKALVEKGESLSSAVKEVSSLRNISKNELYRMAVRAEIS